MLKFDLIQTLAFAGAVLFIGYGIRDFIRPLARHNIPAPVIGGLGIAIAAWIARSQGSTLFTFDTTLQSPLMIAFFTSVGFGASLSLLRVGGPQVLLLFVLATVFAIMQNVLGILIALPFGLDPLFGVPRDRQCNLLGHYDFRLALRSGVRAGGMRRPGNAKVPGRDSPANGTGSGRQ